MLLVVLHVLQVTTLVKPPGTGQAELFTFRAAWIREQMRKRLGQTEDEAKASSSQLHPDDELYAVPADLQVCSFCLLTEGS